MTDYYSSRDNDPFFDFDGVSSDQTESLYLKGEYNRDNSPVTTDRFAKGKSVTPSTSGNFSAKSSGLDMSERDAVKANRYKGDSPVRSPSPVAVSPSYSDSFNSEDSNQDSRHATPMRTEQKRSRRGRGRGYSSDVSHRFDSGTSSHDSKSVFRSYGASSNYGKTNRAARKAPQKPAAAAKRPAGNNARRSNSTSGSSQMATTPRKNEVARRMLSAKGHTISRLRNEFNQLQKEHDAVVKENKLMRQLQHRQEKALSKFDSEESGLPQLLRKHSAELDSVRRRIRKYQERDRECDRRMKDKDEQLLQAQDELSHVRAIAEDRGLLERHELQRRMGRLEAKLQDRDKIVRDLERYVESMKKNHHHRQTERQSREQELKAEVQNLEAEKERLQMMLREKEKELEVRNIYSNRLIKPPPKLRSTNISPSSTVPSLRPVMVNKATCTAVEQTRAPRPPSADKGQRVLSAEELKRREETTARVKSPKEEGVVKVQEERPPPRKVKEHEESTEADKSDGGKRPATPEHERILRGLDVGWERRGGAEESDATRRRRQDEARETIRKSGKGEDQGMSVPGEWRTEEEERNEQQAKIKSVKDKKMEKVADKMATKVNGQGTASYSPDFDNSSDEKGESFPFFGAKQKGGPPSGNSQAKSPPYAVNSVRDLHNYTRGESSPKLGQDKAGMPKKADHAAEAKQLAEAEGIEKERRKKDLLLAQMRAIDEYNGKTESSSSAIRARKAYNFSQPVENLHNGMPSHPDTAAAPAKKDDVSFGNYAPTLSSSERAHHKPKKKSFFNDDSDDSGEDSKEVFAKPKKAAPPPSQHHPADKKSDLMANLFGDQGTEGGKQSRASFNADKNVFTTLTKAKPVAYPWEKKANQQGTNEPSVGATNGPSGIIKPTRRMSHDSLDDIDDLEEVIL